MSSATFSAAPSVKLIGLGSFLVKFTLVMVMFDMALLREFFVP